MAVPVRARASQTWRSISGLVLPGELRGRLDRSIAHAPVSRSFRLAVSQRRFHLCAVQFEVDRQAAACLSLIPSLIINQTSSRRPAGPSRALA